MKVGDLVQIKQVPDVAVQTTITWNEFMGKTGIVIAEASRVHVPAFKVFLKGGIAEFDLDEIIKIGEDDG